jgi:hypothetical protein
MIREATGNEFRHARKFPLSTDKIFHRTDMLEGRTTTLKTPDFQASHARSTHIRVPVIGRSPAVEDPYMKIR